MDKRFIGLFNVYASGQAYSVVRPGVITGTPPVPSFAKMGKALSLIKSIKSSGKSRVFWSGGEKAKRAAEAFAKKNGQTTLEMTKGGKKMETLTKNLTWPEKAPLWQKVSSGYANGVKSGSTIHVFQNAEIGVSLNSVWKTIEYSILNSKGVNIIYHSIP